MCHIAAIWWCYAALNNKPLYFGQTQLHYFI